MLLGAFLLSLIAILELLDTSIKFLESLFGLLAGFALRMKCLLARIAKSIIIRCALIRLSSLRIRSLRLSLRGGLSLRLDPRLGLAATIELTSRNGQTYPLAWHRARENNPPNR